MYTCTWICMHMESERNRKTIFQKLYVYWFLSSNLFLYSASCKHYFSFSFSAFDHFKCCHSVTVKSSSAVLFYLASFAPDKPQLLHITGLSSILLHADHIILIYASTSGCLGYYYASATVIFFLLFLTFC